MECCKASQFSNDAGARIWQAADVGYLALRYGAWLTWACLTLQLSSHLVPLLLQESSHLVPLLLQESSLHFLSFLLKLFWFTCNTAFTLATSKLGQTGLLLFLKADISTTADTFSSTSYPNNINL